MKKPSTGIAWIVSCLACGILSWYVHKWVIKAEIREHYELYAEWQNRMTQTSVSPGEVVTAKFDVLSPGIQCLLLNTNQNVMANVSIDKDSRTIADITLYGQDGKIVLSGNCYPDGSVKNICVFQNGCHLREWGFSKHGLLDYQTVFTNNLGARQYLAPDGKTTNTVFINIIDT